MSNESTPKHVFTGVFIPVKIWLHPDFTPVEKMMLAEIKALSEDSGWCYAGNAHFAKWLKCSPQNVSIYINSFRKKGFIDVKFSDEKTHSGRKMRVNLAWYHGLQDPLSPAVPPLSPAVPPLSPAVPPLSPAVTDIHFKYTSILNVEGERESEKTPSLPKDFDEMIQRVNAEVSTIEAEKEKGSPVPAAPSFSGSDISDEADELKNGVVRRDGPNYEPTDFDFYSKVPLSDMLEDAPVMLVQSFDGQTLPGALVTTVEALNFEHTTRETAATASILKATGREIQCETADDANDLITAWAESNMATIENWYNRSKRVMSAVDLQNIITKFCGTYANHSDSGKRLRFLADPVLFFRNQCSGWLIDQNKFDREQAAKPNTGKFQQQDNAAAYVAPKAVRPVQTFYE